MGGVEETGQILSGERERVVWRYEWQDEGADWRVYSDSDWAGDKKTRKSCSGGVLMKGTHCIKTWCSTQGALALSSAEAEFYSMVEGVLRGYEMIGLSRELGEEVSVVKVILGTDSSAAKAFGCRRGVGKMRHMQVKWLWLQEEVKRGNVKVFKVKGVENPADSMTKFLTGEEIKRQLEAMNLEAMKPADDDVTKEIKACGRRLGAKANAGGSGDL